jgi:hypothetical protein
MIKFEIYFLLKDEINIINSDPFQKTLRWVKNYFCNIYIHILIILLVEYSSMADQSITSKIIPLKKSFERSSFF